MRSSLSSSSELMFSFSKMTAMPSSLSARVVEAVHRVAGEAGDRFGEDDVYLPLAAVADHAHEVLRAFFTEVPVMPLSAKMPAMVHAELDMILSV